MYKDFYIVYEYDYKITKEKYYCNDVPSGTWLDNQEFTFYSWRNGCNRNYIELKWQEDTIAIYSKFCDEALVESGEITEDEMEFGHWKFYNKDSGKIMSEGDYYYGRKVGIWKIYNKRGKVKAEVSFDECKSYLDYIMLNHKYDFPRQERIECNYRFSY